MDLELYSILSVIIVLATVITVIYAFFAYIVFRMRQRASMSSGPRAARVHEAAPTISQPEFFRPYVPRRLR